MLLHLSLFVLTTSRHALLTSVWPEDMRSFWINANKQDPLHTMRCYYKKCEFEASECLRLSHPVLFIEWISTKHLLWQSADCLAPLVSWQILPPCDIGRWRIVVRTLVCFSGGLEMTNKFCNWDLGTRGWMYKITYTTVQKVGVGKIFKCFWNESLLLTNAAFILLCTQFKKSSIAIFSCVN